MQQVHLRVNDAESGKPTPVRLRITDAEGNYYAPYGRLTEFATGVNQDVGGNVQLGAKKWAYIDGSCEILLPPGKLHVEITKGPEYKPIDEDIELLAGKMSMRFTIERWCDMRKEGWYSGDTRVHFMTPDAALLEGEAEDLAVVNLLAKEAWIPQTYGRTLAIPNILSFSGQSFARQNANCGVAVNTQNRYVRFGSLGLLHCHRIVFPLTCDSCLWTFGDWCGQCHRKKGLVVWTEAGKNAPHLLRGPLADVVLGDIDALEILHEETLEMFTEYYRLLEAGVRVPLVGASGKEDNKRTIGAMRTYVNLLPGAEFSYSTWIESLRAGRTFVTCGPILDFNINGEVPAEKIIASEQTNLNVLATVSSTAVFSRLELLWNGEVIASANPAITTLFRATIDHQFRPNESGWLMIRCLSESTVLAHSSASFVQFHDKLVTFKPRALESIIAELDSFITYAHGHGYDSLCKKADEARTVLINRLS